MTGTHRSRSRAGLWAIVGGLVIAAAQAQPVSKNPAPWLPPGMKPECLFREGTVIPMLAIGVRKPDDSEVLRERRLLDLWERPAAASEPGGEPLERVPLFRPYFVYGKRDEGGVRWYLLGQDYAGTPLGWANGQQLHLLENRSGYHFNNPKRVPPGVHLYGSPGAAYQALEFQSRVPPETPLEGVVVAERIEAEHWNPLSPDAIPPFIELGDEDDLGDRSAAGLTDTTLTFPFPGENRLVRLGAVAGGPVARVAIDKMKAAAQERAGIAIVFVIDETYSMQKFFGGVADFIDKNLDLGDSVVNIRVAVSWYSDIEKQGDVSYVVQPLQPLNGPGMEAAAAQAAKGRLVSQVRTHKERIIGGMGGQAEELVYAALKPAIETAGFQPGENAMVFVIGDAPDRSEEQELIKLQQDVAALIEKHAVQLAFVQVGDDLELTQRFTKQAEEFRNSLDPALQQSVIVQKPEKGDLSNRIAALQAQMDSKRRALLDEIEEMETRNPYSQPGPALEREFSANGIDRKAFDAAHLQFFVPAWGWLYHPQQAEATPQLRELVFLAKPESDALIPTLIKAAEGLEKTGRVDVDAARKLLADVLGTKSGHSGVAVATEAAWQSLPTEDRTLGRFLEQGMGLRVRNPLLFHRGTASPAAGPTQQSVQLLRTSLDQIENARKKGVTWVDAWKVLP